MRAARVLRNRSYSGADVFVVERARPIAPSPLLALSLVSEGSQALSVQSSYGSTYVTPGASAGAGAVVVLDKHTKNVSSNPGREAQALAKQRVTRGSKIRLREVLWDNSDDVRAVGCGRRRIEGGSPVTVRVNAGVAHYANVQLCGSIHSCPVCAPKIRQKRAEEIEHALNILHQTPLVWGHNVPGEKGLRCDVSERDSAQLGSVEFLTLTMPHDFGDKTAELLTTVALGFRRVVAGSGYKRDRETFGIVGTIRSLDVTYGPNGAHPHLHALLILSRPLSDTERVSLHSSFFARWKSTVASLGYDPPLPGLCPMEPVRSVGDVAKYVAKMSLVEDADRKSHRVGLEMARHDLKTGRESDSRGRGKDAHRTPFQVLADFTVSGDMAEIDLFNAYARAIKGHQAITWSRGLKAVLAVHEMTDEELAAEEVGGSDIIALEDGEWSLVVRTRGGTARVLELAETEGAVGVFAYICELASKPPPWPRARSGTQRLCEIDRLVC